MPFMSPKNWVGYMVAGGAGALITLVLTGAVEQGFRKPAPEMSLFTPEAVPSGSQTAWKVRYQADAKDCDVDALEYAANIVVGRLESGGPINVGGNVSANLDGFGSRTITNSGTNQAMKFNVVYHAANEDDAANEIMKLCPGSGYPNYQ